MTEKISRSEKPALWKWAPVIGRIAAFAAFVGGSFVIAGRLDWIQGWVFFALFVGYGVCLLWWLSRSNPDLFAERGRTGKNVENWDKVIMRLYTGFLISLIVVAALDSGRYAWSRVPISIRIAAWVGLGLSGTVIWHVMAVNAYLSSMVRIQEERGHQVATEGLYGYIRHPMYLAIIVLMLCVPLALGSLWALIPGGMIVALFVYRTAREDQTLIEKLPGYREYTQQVRYRLLPGVW
ncbi:MAG: isoprenylcysteine carboxylmethyltransferase family protein [Anaerolineae bacterium]|nr:isoprenylcysteine carboxylmethyltransferase family protein [Anaerolineae bacterium]